MSHTKLPPVTNVYRRQTSQLDLPPRLLFGAGPSNLYPRVVQAMGMPLVGHLDPRFVEVMGDIQDLLCYAWQTDNRWTFPISGTGSAATEAAIANMIEPGDVMLVGVNGYFSERICTIAARYGADVRRLEKHWGGLFTPEEVRAAVELYRPAVLALVHGETSTGVEQPLTDIGDICRAHDCLFLVDSVASLCALPLYVDAWNIDICYSASHTCLSAAPGIAPITFSARAVEKIQSRREPVRSWYWDAVLLQRYWAEPHVYHHTAPMTLNYGLRESLRQLAEEGLSESWQRHHNNAELFWMGLMDLNLKCLVAEKHRLPSLTTIKVPDGVDARSVARYLLNHFNIEIGLGLGELAGKVWRVGLMGFNSRAENVIFLLRALQEALQHAR